MTTISPDELSIRPPFSVIFDIEPRTLEAVTVSMRVIGYDHSKPINVWRNGNVILDGHTRQQAAINAGIEDVPIYLHDFATEDEALAYAIANQRDRRNLTNADLLRCIELVDKRKQRGGDRGNQHTGGKVSTDTLPETSAEATAKIVGVSPATVNRVRAIIDASTEDPSIKEEVLKGKKSIRGAARDVADRKRKKAPAYTAVMPPSTVANAPAPSLASVVQVDETTRAWLDSHPLRARVVGHRFDEDALIYREFSTAMGAIRGRMHQLIGLRSGKGMTHLYAALMQLSPLPAINSWTVCDKCHGAGANGSPCKVCRGGGYLIPGF